MAMSAKWALPVSAELIYLFFTDCTTRLTLDVMQLAELSGSAVLARVFGESGLGDITYTVFKRLMMLKDPVAASTPVDRFR